MKINNQNSPSFQKRLVAAAKIGKMPNLESVKIYNLDKAKDIVSLKSAAESSDWKRNSFLDCIIKHFRDDIDYNEILAMETLDGRIINVAKITKNFMDGTCVNFLETAPGFAYGSAEERKYKHAGETMLAYIAKTAKNEGAKRVHAFCSDWDVINNFYSSKCGFDYDLKQNIFLDKKHFDDFINANESATGSKIELIG